MFSMYVACDMHTTLYSQYCDMHASLNMHESRMQHVHFTCMKFPLGKYGKSHGIQAITQQPNLAILHG